MYRITRITVLIIALTIFIQGCATFRSEINGMYSQSAKRNNGAPKVSALFIFSHYRQAVGFDAIPKLETKHQIIDGFDDLFMDAFNEISNIGRYSAYTEFSSDVSDSRRRAEKDSMIATHDYIFRIKFMKRNSFSSYALGTLVSTASATLFPFNYSRQYTLTVELYNREALLVGSYTRTASLNKWVEGLLIIVYPFHPEKRKEEEFYMLSMHDVFRQIESDCILK